MEECSLSEKTRETIRHLNDSFRSGQSADGTTIVSHRVKAHGIDFVDAALGKIRGFSEFTVEHDPKGEHNFGVVEVYGQPPFFEIECFNPELTAPSQDPADTAITHRVLTVMLPGEY